MSILCRLLGHEFYWLDSRRQCHCRRCGKRDDAHFERQERLDEIVRVAARLSADMDR